jgi:hypothetical protein
MSDRSIFANMLQEYNVNRIRQVNSERDARINKLATRADAENYCMEVRCKIASCFNMPERSGLPPVKITGTYELPECRVEKIIYESRPEFPVTALLYVPKSLSAPAPAVLFLCGHSQSGKAEAIYSKGCRTLAKAGYVVLCVDPVGQGERYQFTGVKNSVGVSGFCTREHNMLGKQMSLCGEFFGTWRAHDALSGLDYLLSRPEVDPHRVGITGNSGGGTTSLYAGAILDRLTHVMPSCCFSSYRDSIMAMIHCKCNYFPGMLEWGDMGDLAGLCAPKYLVIVNGRKDVVFPVGPARKEFKRTQAIYNAAGVPDRCRMVIGNGGHRFYKADAWPIMERFLSEK